MKPTTRSLPDLHERFHQEFFDFERWAMVDDLLPHEMLFRKVKKIIKTAFPMAKFVLFGSTGAKLAIKGSDIDIAVIDNSSDFV